MKFLFFADKLCKFRRSLFVVTSLKKTPGKLLQRELFLQESFTKQYLNLVAIQNFLLTMIILNFIVPANHCIIYWVISSYLSSSIVSGFTFKTNFRRDMHCTLDELILKSLALLHFWQQSLINFCQKQKEIQALARFGQMEDANDTTQYLVNLKVIYTSSRTSSRDIYKTLHA